MLKNIVFSIAVLAAVFSVQAAASPVEVGTGTNTAYVYIEWKDGFVMEYNVSFGETAGETTTGLGLLDIIEAETALVTYRGSGGAFINGLEYETHANVGYDGGENWWHYWVKNSNEAEWTTPWTYGAADRIVNDGDSDGWIYGSAYAVPEPMTLMLLGLGGLFLRSRKA